jgi:hypothetical protein
MAIIDNLTATWNSGGTTFSALKMNVTDTASAAASMLLNLLVGSVEKFAVTKAGDVRVNTDKFTVAGASGNTAVAGTLGVTGAATLSSTLAVTGAATLTGAVTGGAAIKSSSASGGIGYATGAGGAVTQGTGRTTTVICNAVAGAITLVSAAGSATPFSFTVTNSAVAATDVIVLSQKSGTDKYILEVTAVGAGSFQITAYTTGGTTTEQPVFNFAVIKAVAA